MEEPSWMAKLTHRTVRTNGINVHGACGGSWAGCVAKASTCADFRSQVGRAERDFEKVGTKASLAKLLFMDPNTALIAPKDAELVEWLPLPEKQPSYITDFDYQENWKKSGWTGALNWYRNLDKTWELCSSPQHSSTALGIYS